MGFYDDNKNVESYVKMAEGYDGRELIEQMASHLKPGATVLELGMGPGVDFDILSEHYQVTGSDNSQNFLDRYWAKTADADLLLLDAVTLETERRFDAIYSNKVLHHLTTDELQTSLQRQAKLLNDNGYLFHSFWLGEGAEEHYGMYFVYYTEDVLNAQIAPEFEVVELSTYTEMDKDDSLFLVLRKQISA